MQARNLPPPPAAAELGDDVDDVGVELLEVADDPQAAATSATAASPAAIRIFARKIYLLWPRRPPVTPGERPA
jgi:hypothetical protein